MARRGFFAEMNRQLKIAQREQDRRQRVAIRAQSVQARQYEQAKAALAHAEARLSRAAASDRKRLDKEARDAYFQSRQEEAESRSEALADAYAEIDFVLQATLSRDDYVDLNALRISVQHPPFDRLDLTWEVTPPSPIARPKEPVLVLPDPPKGVAKLFGKPKYEEAVAAASSVHARARAEWAAACAAAERQHAEALAKHAQKEQQRLDDLAREHARYERDCQARDEAAAAQNQILDEFIVNLGYGTAESIHEYVAIVLGNSVYPDQLPVKHEFTFDPEVAELVLRVRMAEPSQLPSAKLFKYVKASDEIVAVPASQKECKDRYTSAVHQVALRSIHEVFEADRRGLIRTIALEVVTSAVDPSTGIRADVPLVVVGAERDVFMTFDLSAVVPEKTLIRLGAAMSKNPYGLVPAERSGVRRA
jgi:restriction system protein